MRKVGEKKTHTENPGFLAERCGYVDFFAGKSARLKMLDWCNITPKICTFSTYLNCVLGSAKPYKTKMQRLALNRQTRSEVTVSMILQYCTFNGYEYCISTMSFTKYSSDFVCKEELFLSTDIRSTYRSKNQLNYEKDMNGFNSTIGSIR